MAAKPDRDSRQDPRIKAFFEDFERWTESADPFERDALAARAAPFSAIPGRGSTGALTPVAVPGWGLDEMPAGRSRNLATGRLLPIAASDPSDSGEKISRLPELGTKLVAISN